MSSSALLVVPAYRCAPQIGRTLSRLHDPAVAGRFGRILVLDNRSPDGTVDAAIAAAEKITGCPVAVARNRANVGLGGSHKVAFLAALAEGRSHVAVLHGDDQADIADLLPELDAGLHERHDCLLGARFAEGSRLEGYSRLRVAGNRVFNRLFGAAVGREVLDLGSGLNMFRMSAFADRMFLRWADDLTFNYHLILATATVGADWRFFPISWREADQRSNVRMARQASAMLRMLVEYRLDRTDWLATDFTAGKGAALYATDIVWQRA